MNNGGRMERHTVLDIETLGTRPGCAFMSVGAVRVEGLKVKASFERVIDLQTCLDAGLRIEAGTVMWWMMRPRSARMAWAGPGVERWPLRLVLEQFAEFVEGSQVWGCSPSFDCAILAAGYKALGMRVPWFFFEERDVRTARALFRIDKAAEGKAAHTALADAMREAKELIGYGCLK